MPLFPPTNRRSFASLVGKPWLHQVVSMGVLFALFSPAYVSNFGSASKREPPAHRATRTARDARWIAVYVRAAATRYDVPERLVTAIIAVESDFDPQAVSPRGATGLMQLTAGTAATVGVRDRLNAPQNIDGGVRHLRTLMDRFGDNLPLVLAAYNAGERAVASYRGIPPYPETRRFVVRVLRRLGDRRAAELVLAQSAPRGRARLGRRTAVARDIADHAIGPNRQATSRNVTDRRTRDADGPPTAESNAAPSTPRQRPVIQPP